MKNPALAACWLIASLTAQTKVDLQNQSKNVNLQTAPFTAPLKSGAVLPTSCTQAQLFFVTTVPAGTNLFGCIASNTWSLEGWGGSSGGALAVDNNGATVGSRGIVNFISGSGMLNVITDDGTKIDVQQTVDSAVVLTRAGHQSGETLLCTSSGGSGSAYTCAMSPTLDSYQIGMVLNWTPDVSATGGATTLNVDSLGAQPVKLADGVTDPVLGDVSGGRMSPVWFDGTVFRLMNPVMVSALAGTQPACSSALRGRIWTTFGESGVKDSVTVCAKDSSDAYQWRVLY